MLKELILLYYICFFVFSLFPSALNGEQSYPVDEKVNPGNHISFESSDIKAEYCDYICGDTNDDGTVNLLDITFLISYLYSVGTAPESVNASDVNGSGTINLLDITALILSLYQGGPALDGCPYLIKIVGLQLGDGIVSGTANVFDTSETKVVLWAKTDRWYVQPSIAEPFTIIQGNGTWSNSTYPWERMVALLVDSSYVPGSIREYHPSLDQGVICWDEYPDKSIRYIYWSDYRWKIKDIFFDPGPNYFSDDTTNVFIDQENRLHLKIDFRNDNWYCAEVVLDHSLGYGVYTFKLESRVDNLDYNSIFAGFIYETINEEFDIEFSQRLVADTFNAQYVTQPWNTPGNLEVFNMPSNIQTSHSFEWRSDRIVFNSWNGHSDTPTPETLIHSWTYTGEDIPIPGGEGMIFNLYLYGGQPPVSGIGDEVIINSFEYAD